MIDDGVFSYSKREEEEIAGALPQQKLHWSLEFKLLINRMNHILIACHLSYYLQPWQIQK